MAIGTIPTEQAIIPFAVWWPQLLDATHIIVTGGKGSGKTTLVRALLLALAEQGVRFVLIDPHYRRGDWGANVHPLAGGRRFEEARAAFAWGTAELDRRYKARADHGADDFAPIAYVVDEFDIFTGKRPDVADDLRELASRFLAMIGDESRKVGLRLIVIAHGTEVRNLALEGRGSKRHNYTLVELRQGLNHRPEATGTLRSGSSVQTIDTRPILDIATGTLTPDMLIAVPSGDVDITAGDQPSASRRSGRPRDRSVPPVPRIIDRVEVPVMTPEHLAEAHALAARLTEVGRALLDQAERLITALQRVEALGASASLKGYGEPQAPAAPETGLPSGQHDSGAAAVGEASLLVPLGRAERAVLTVLAQYDRPLAKAQLAILAGYAVTGGGFNNALGALRTKGLVQGREQLTLTMAGRQALGTWEPLPTGAALIAYWHAKLGKAERAILHAVLDAAGRPLSKDDIAARAGYVAEGGGFNNALGRLRTLQLVEGYREIRVNADLLLAGRSGSES